MHERIEIRNFAGIQELDLTLGQINIIIGPQAVGKSITAKLLFFLKSVVSVIITLAQNANENFEEVQNTLNKQFKAYFPPESWGEVPFVIRYEFESLHIEITPKNTDTIALDFSPYYLQLFKKSLDWFQPVLDQSKLNFIVNPNVNNALISLYSARFQLLSNLTTEIDRVLGFEQFYIPAGRSFFANVQAAIFSLLQSNSDIDPFIKQFGAFYEIIKGENPEGPTEGAALINERIDQILGGTYVKEGKKEYFMLPDNRKVRLHNSSSGQQEVLPLTLIFKILGEKGGIGVIGQTLYIEEPEAHLFPTAQKLTVELMAMAFNLSQKTQFIITTHSPYLLTAFNTLLQAGSIIAHDPSKKEAVQKIVAGPMILEPFTVRAYAMNREETTSIINPENGLIEGDLIDSVSDELAASFNALLDLEYQG